MPGHYGGGMKPKGKTIKKGGKKMPPQLKKALKKIKKK